ncbi:MAG TPA: carbohydrate porin [Tepidisphaeraceae bacterium]|nr:carbohydrate porin [Tepidisphaeraceae bacterium]
MAQDEDGGVIDSQSAMIPLEPDEIPPRSEIPQPATFPSTAPTIAPAPENAAIDPIAGLFGRVHDPLADKGISLSLSMTADWAKNFTGGLNTAGSDFNHLLNVTLTLDTKKLLNIEGGTIFVNFQQQHGESGSVDAGDIQDVSSIAADGRTQLDEIWYQESFLNEKVRVKLGKIDAGSEFCLSENASDFLNGGMSTAASNELLPTYPDAAFGGEIFVKPCDAFYAQAGIFDGALQEGVKTGENGPRTLFGPPADLYLTGEAGLLWEKAGKTGRLGLGVWHHTGTFDKFTGGTADGATGFYITFDQTLIRENPDQADDAQGLGMFIIYDHAQESIIDIDHHLSTGLAYTGLLPNRDNDVVGAGVTWAHLSDHAGFEHDAETTIETFYKLQLTPWFSVQPDLQYVIDPATANHDALVGTLRLAITF